MNKKRLNIKIMLNDNTSVFNDYNSDQLSNELSGYIYSQCKGTPVNQNININIYYKQVLSESEKEHIIDVIRSNYGIDIKENILMLKLEMIKELILIILGSIFLVLAHLLNYFNINIIGEIVSIFAWVIIWEVAYNVIFMDTKLRYENKRLKRLVQSRIKFIKE